MILIKSSSQIAEMRKANQIVRDTLALLIEHTKPGASTYDLNRLAHDYITSQNAIQLNHILEAMIEASASISEEK